MLPWLGLPQPGCCNPGPDAACLRHLKEVEREAPDQGAKAVLVEPTPAIPPSTWGLGHAGGNAGNLALLRGSLPPGPRERTVPSYTTEGNEALVGEPFSTGSILRLTLGESIHEMHLALYVNGFSLTAADPAARSKQRPTVRLWSPFSLVEKCQVKAMQHAAYWAVFKLTVFRREGMDLSYYFACTGTEAYKERDKWVDEISTAIANVTVSLFPQHAITVEPIPGKQATYTRIMAGYLLQGGSADKVTLMYCELHAYSQGGSRMVLYTDEWCEQEVVSIHVSEASTVSTRKGAYCTVFGVDFHRFCARTREEKELWLRAVSNIKVKLMFEAPDPTEGELAIFRAAVCERLDAMPQPLLTPRGHAPGAPAAGAAGAPAGDCPQPEQAAESPRPPPLLPEVPRRPPAGPRGDVWDPSECTEEDPESSDLEGRGATTDGELEPSPWWRKGSAVCDLEPAECRRVLKSVAAKLGAGPSPRQHAEGHPAAPADGPPSVGSPGARPISRPAGALREATWESQEQDGPALASPSIGSASGAEGGGGRGQEAGPRLLDARSSSPGSATRRASSAPPMRRWPLPEGGNASSGVDGMALRQGPLTAGYPHDLYVTDAPPQGI